MWCYTANLCGSTRSYRHEGGSGTATCTVMTCSGIHIGPELPFTRFFLTPSLCLPEGYATDLADPRHTKWALLRRRRRQRRLPLLRP